MTKKIIDRLRNDEDYYGEFGQQFLSNSNIGTLLKNPARLRDKQANIPAFLVGGYFHTAILEPEKLNSFKIVEATTRNTKKYKELSEGEMCLLQHEVDQVELMQEAVMANDVCRDLIAPVLGNYIYEEPAVIELFGNMWKGKADIVNHDEKLVIDLKTTSDIEKFRWSASKYNYDSQAYIYSKLFGYEMVFIVIDKNTKQIGVFDCSPDFYKRGEDKVRRASEAYDLYYGDEEFDFKQFLLNDTL
jgi:hypothetical protein|tara:strand:+ start:705 stop:1439 length:735 start_codon:yes stop_codon:yes gene_type:complete